jgi:hypothetical protein
MFYLEKSFGFGEPISEQQVLDRINRVPYQQTEAMKKGVNFEDKVVAFMQGKNTFSEDWELKLLNDTSEELPDFFVTQRFIDFVHKDCRIYGYSDFTGAGKIIDLKTTSYYQFPSHEDNVQTLYLYGLKHLGFEEMKYIIVNLEEKFIATEVYHSQNYDFDRLFEWVDLFKNFLEINRYRITDQKILV